MVVSCWCLQLLASTARGGMDHTEDARLDKITRPPRWRHLEVEKIERGGRAAVHDDHSWFVWPCRDEPRIGRAYAVRTPTPTPTPSNQKQARFPLGLGCVGSVLVFNCRIHDMGLLLNCSVLVFNCRICTTSTMVSPYRYGSFSENCSV